jgi:hypothetical protein
VVLTLKEPFTLLVGCDDAVFQVDLDTSSTNHIENTAE